MEIEQGVAQCIEIPHEHPNYDITTGYRWMVWRGFDSYAVSFSTIRLAFDNETIHYEDL